MAQERYLGGTGFFLGCTNALTVSSAVDKTNGLNMVIAKAH